MEIVAGERLRLLTADSNWALRPPYEFFTRRNEHAANAAAAVPLTDVTDLNNQTDETKPQPMPDLKFQYDGHPQTMRTLIVEPGAVAPPQTSTQ